MSSDGDGFVRGFMGEVGCSLIACQSEITISSIKR